jgi:transcriptional regulator with XRE-family HTH domain
MSSGPPRIRADDGKLNIVGARVKGRRKALKLTRDVLCARLADITKRGWVPTETEIYRLESGRRSVTDIELLWLSRVLECEVVWLLTG